MQIYYTSMFVCTLWLINLAGHTLLHGSLIVKFFSLPNCCVIYHQILSTYEADNSLKLSFTLNCVLKHANDLKTISNWLILLSTCSWFTGGPSSQYEELCVFFFYFYANVQRNVTWGIYCNYLTIELDHAKRDSCLAAYGGVVLQGFEVWIYKVCMGTQRFCWKSQVCLYFVNKIYLPCCCVVFFLFASSSGRSNAILASYRSVGFHC